MTNPYERYNPYRYGHINKNSMPQYPQQYPYDYPGINDHVHDIYQIQPYHQYPPIHQQMQQPIYYKEKNNNWVLWTILIILGIAILPLLLRLIAYAVAFLMIGVITFIAIGMVKSNNEKKPQQKQPSISNDDIPRGIAHLEKETAFTLYVDDYMQKIDTIHIYQPGTIVSFDRQEYDNKNNNILQLMIIGENNKSQKNNVAMVTRSDISLLYH